MPNAEAPQHNRYDYVPLPQFNDSPQIIHRQHSAREFCDMLVDQFEEMSPTIV